jgi:hypothetical protein
MRLLRVCGTLGLLVCWSSVAVAQSTIAGVVRDATGSVVPGVAVEASSPVLIEKARQAVTGGEGRYTIIDLRPGVYRVAFTLAGFRTLIREGVEVPADVSVPLYVDLEVGSVSEAVVVPGQSPAVDVQNAGRVQIVSRAAMDAIPTARTFQSIAALVPGLRLTFPEVGGAAQMEPPRMQARGNGARHVTVQLDGMLTNSLMNDGEVPNYFDNALIQEATYQTSGVTADVAAGGVRLNIIPKDGGNRLAGSAFLGGSSGRWQSRNVTPALTARGLRGGSSIKHIQDFNASVGGPIVRDTVWFFGAGRYQSTNDAIANSFYSDGSPGVQDQWVRGGVGRLTWQPTPRHKVSGLLQENWKFKGHELQAPAQTQIPADPAVASTRRAPAIYYVAQLKWTAPLTNRLLLESGYSSDILHFTNLYQPGIGKERGSAEWYTTASRVDTVTGLRHAAGVINQTHLPDRHTLSGSLSYATGSHNVKTGAQWSFGSYTQVYDMNADLYQNYLNGVPATVTVFSTPVRFRSNVDADLGLYAQDAWSIDRATITAGLRYEFFKVSIPAQQRDAGRFAPAASYAALNCDTNPGMTCWHSVSPRLGVSYDLFGNVRTAVKGGFGKYMTPETTGFASLFNPVTVVLENRSWTDPNRDNIAQDTEIGPTSNPNFGKLTSRTLDPHYQREYNLQYHAGVQHEIARGATVGLFWHRRTLHNSQFSDDRSVNAAFSGPTANWTPVEVVNPLTGERMTVFNLLPPSFGLAPDIYLTNAGSSERRNIYTGIELSTSARLRGGGTVLAGWNIERTLSVTCDSTDDPNSLRFCDQGGRTRVGEPAIPMPFRHELKISGNLSLPYSFEVSASFQSYPGLQRDVNWTITRGTRYPADCAVPGCTPGALVLPTLTNPSVTVPLIAPGSRFRDRQNQLDLGLRRTFRLGGSRRVDAQLDVFNALNSNAVLTESFALGNSVAPFLEGGPGGTPLSIFQPRILRIATQFRF